MAAALLPNSRRTSNAMGYTHGFDNSWISCS